MSAREDEYVRRYELEKVERAVGELRTQIGNVDQRHDDLREADNRAHAAEHKAEELARSIAAKEAAEKARKDREWTWYRALGVITALGVLVGAWYEILHR